MRKQFFGGVMGQGAGLASTLAIQIVQVPIFLLVLGADGYGTYLLTIAVPSLLVLTDFGLLAAFSTAMLQSVAEGNVSRARQLSQLCSAVLYGLGALFALAVGAGFLILSEADFGLAAWSPMVFLLYGLYALVALQTSAIEGIFRADGQQGITWTLIAVLRTAEFALAAVALVASSNVVWFVVTLLAVRVAGTVLLWIRSAVKVPWSSRRPSVAGWRSSLYLVRPMVGSVAQPATNYIYIQGTTLVVGWALGPAVVAQLGVLRTLAGLLKQGAQVFTQASMPLVTRASLAGGAAGVRRQYRSVISAVAITVIPLAALLVGFGPVFVHWWTGGDIDVDSLLITVFVVEALVEIVLLICALGLIARNRHFGLAIGALIAACAFVVVVVLVGHGSLAQIVLVQTAFIAATAGWALFLHGRGRRVHEPR